MPDKKKCTKCRRNKDRSQYTERSNGTLQARCESCQREDRAESKHRMMQRYIEAQSQALLDKTKGL